ncbi:MAG: SGNH/GDSL hydrolase family protein, partial [Cephaloticoccus sp.]
MGFPIAGPGDIPRCAWVSQVVRSVDVSLIPRALSRLQSDRPLRIVGLGDSITGIYYHTGATLAWPEVLGIKLRALFPQAPIEIINAGISGHTTADGLTRLESDVLAHAPNLVVVMFGMNDVVRSTPEAYADHLRRIVRQLSARGVEVVLMTPNSVYDEDPARP